MPKRVSAEEKCAFVAWYQVERRTKSNKQIATEIGIKADSLATKIARYGGELVPDVGLDPLVHGTAHGYQSHDCRCDSCREAHSAYQGEMRRARNARLARGETKFWHGASGYVNWGCRCEVCAEGHRAKMVEQYNRRKSADRSALNHGRASTYISFGCRCDDCWRAAREYGGWGPERPWARNRVAEVDA